MDVGGGGSAYTGTAIQYLLPHNNDEFTFYADKRMKFLIPFGLTNNTLPTSTNACTSMDNSLFHPFTITLTQKHMPSVLKYDSSVSPIKPTNFAPYLALGYSDLFNASADTALTQLQMEFSATLYYKDA